MNRLTIINKDISINTKHIDEFELELKSGTKKMKEKFHNKAIKERNAYINKEIDKFMGYEKDIYKLIKKKVNEIYPKDNTLEYDKYREKLSDYQEEYGDLYNLEATPAESTSYRLAKHDRKQFPNIITASEKGNTPYYTNSSHLPVGYTEDVFSALDIQDDLQTLYTSGTVFHVFLGQKLPSWKSCMNLVRKIAENYEIPYYTMSPTYSVCRDHGYITGEVYQCPHCGKPTEVYSRITGYYRPIQNWNVGKTEEFKNRRTYVLENSHLKNERSVSACECESKEETINIPQEIMLFGTKTCPNCKMAKMLLEKANIKYVWVDAEEEKEKTIALNIKKAPTLVVPNGSGFDFYENASNIKGFIESQK